MEWIDVNDRLPIDCSQVDKYETAEVMIVSDGIVEFVEFSCGPLPKPWFKFDDYHLAFITHWMDKPEPPQ